MICPKCEYVRQPADVTIAPATECPACGLVYVKYGAQLSADQDAQLPTPHLKKRSPVDAQSLRQARERVEKRLRKKMEMRIRDERHSQMLEKARAFASAAVLQRQQEWELKQSQEAEKHAPDIQAAGESTASPEVLGMTDAPPTAAVTVAPTPEPAQDIAGIAPEMSETTPQAPKVGAQRSEKIETPESKPPMPKTARRKPAHSFTDHVTAMRAAILKAQDSTGMEQSEAAPLIVPPIAGRRRRSRKAGGLTRFLPAVAWLILCAGLVGAALSWTTLGDVQASIGTPGEAGFNALPVALLLGFAYLATGVLGFAFFWVASLISVQLKEIRRLLLRSL